MTHARRLAARFAAHRQVLVRVNAPVDEGVSEVIAALSLLPVITLSSCEGNQETHKAEINFRHADSDMDGEIGETEARHRAADFFVWLHWQIFAVLPAEQHRLTAWCYGPASLEFNLTWDNRITSDLVKALRQIASGL